MNNKHLLNGNCWENAYKCKKCGIGELCDVCHKHDWPRGNCQICERCEQCLKDIKDEQI